VSIVDVAAASPAFDAGVRDGDQIVSFDGFQGESYRDWLDGMQRLVRDTPDGAKIYVELLRGGRRVAAQVRVPEARAHDPRVPPQPLGPQPGQPILSGQDTQAQGGIAAIPQPGQPFAGGSGSNIFINNSPFDVAFNAGGADINDRAVAQIFRINPQQQTAVSNFDRRTSAAQEAAQSTGVATGPQPAQQAANGQQRQPGQQQQTTDATSSAGRIGIAGFRNDAEGMLVMIDIAGLEPGSYRVGIDDPAVVVGGGPSTADATATETAGDVPGTNVPPSGLDRPLTTPLSGLDRPLSTPPSGSDSSQSTPATPPSGQARPLTSTPTGLPDSQQGQVGRGLTNGQATPTETPLNGTLSDVGILTVDQSGTGQLQQVVEGVRVADVVGQALVIYAPAQPSKTAIPPDPNVSGVREGAGDPNVPAQSSTTVGRDVPRPAPSTVAADGQQSSSTTPVAAGKIQLLSDRRPGVSAADQADVLPDSRVQRDSSDTDSVERAALPQQPRR
jgi:hypothetical protein